VIQAVIVQAKILKIKKYNWTHALASMYAEVDNSITRHKKANVTGENYLHSLMKDTGHTVWIIDGEIYVEKQFLKDVSDRMKKNLHLRFMWSILKHAKEILERKPEHANDIWYLMNTKTAYTFSAASSGIEQCRDEQIPLVIAKKYGHNMCGILLPNPYFSDLFSEWAPEMKSLIAISRKKSWSKKIPRVFWRGKISSEATDSCEDQAGNFARLSACALTLRHSKYFDVRAVTCQLSLIKSCNESFNFNSYENETLAQGCHSIQGDFVAHRNFSDYQFLLSLPGSTTGSYSRNQNHLWMMGSIVLLWSGPLVEVGGGAQWYSPALADGHTHLVISRETGNIVQQTMQDQVRLQYLLRNAHGVAERILCPRCLASYTLTVLSRIRQAFPEFFAFLNNGHKEGEAVFNTTMRPSKLVSRRLKVLHRYGCRNYELYKVVGPRNFQGPKWSVQTQKFDEMSACKLFHRASR